MFDIEDRRVRKTHNSLLEALMKLTVRHGWTEVNVCMICDEADVSRSTFYSHFNNKHELLDYGYELLAAEIGANSRGRGLDTDGCFGFLPDLLDHVDGHKHLFKTTDSKPSNQMMFSRFRKVVDDMGLKEIKGSSYAARLADEDIAFLSGGIFAVLSHWRATGCAKPASALLGQLDRMVTDFLASATT